MLKPAGAEPAGQMRDENCTPLDVVTARSTFRSQNVQNTSASDHFWKLSCRKKVHAVVARSTFPSQNAQNTCSDHFWTFRCRFAWQAQGIGHLFKSEQNVRVFCNISKNDGRRGTFEEDLARCICVAGAVQETCSSEML